MGSVFEFPANTCRLCIDITENIVDILCNDVLVQEISKLLSIQISSTDALPKQVCKTCLKIVGTWIQFSAVTKTNDKKLKEMLLKGFEVYDKKKFVKKETEDYEEKPIKIEKTDDQQNIPDPLSCKSDSSSQIEAHISSVLKQEQVEEDASKINSNVVVKQEQIDKTAIVKPHSKPSQTLEKIKQTANIRPMIPTTSSVNSEQIETESDIDKCENINASEGKGANVPWKVTIVGNTCSGRFTPECQEGADTMATIKNEMTFLCHLCGERLITAALLQAHTQLHLSVFTHHCPVCNKGLLSLNQLQDHVITHRNDNIFICILCDLQCESSIDLKTHSDEVHMSGRYYKCKVCKREIRFSSDVFYEEHVEMHWKQLIKEPVNTPEKKQLQEQLTSDHNEIRILSTTVNSTAVNTSPFMETKSEVHLTCPLCPNTFVNEIHLQEHISIIHHKHMCHICKKEFLTDIALRSHIQKIHHMSQMYTMYKCSLCSKTFMYQKSLQDHMTTHSEKKDFCCRECNMKFQTDKELQEHTQQAHSSTLYKQGSLEISRDLFETTKQIQELTNPSRASPSKQLPMVPTIIQGTSNGIIRNVTTPTLDGLLKDFWKCMLCNKSYPNELELQKHSKIHLTNGLRFICYKCGDRYRTDASLNFHYLKQHCPICEVVLPSTPDNVKQHVLIVHNINETKVTCPQCNLLLRNETELASHMNHHIGNRPYSCLKCKKCIVFSIHLQYQRHLLLHHVGLVTTNNETASTVTETAQPEVIEIID